MGRPWWHDDYWKKRGIYKPKDEFVEHQERQGKRWRPHKSSRVLLRFWVIIACLVFIVVVLMILGYIFWTGVWT